MQVAGEEYISSLVEKEFRHYKQAQPASGSKSVSSFYEQNYESLQNLHSPQHSQIPRLRRETKDGSMPSEDAKVAEKYARLLELLKVDNFGEAVLKVNRVNESDKFLTRVKEMTRACEPDSKEVNLNQAWKLIKHAVYQAQMGKLGQL